MLCPFCEKELLKTDRRWQFSSEVPYKNTLIHIACWDEIKDNTDKQRALILKIGIFKQSVV